MKNKIAQQANVYLKTIIEKGMDIGEAGTELGVYSGDDEALCALITAYLHRFILGSESPVTENEVTDKNDQLVKFIQSIAFNYGCEVERVAKEWIKKETGKDLGDEDGSEYISFLK